MSRPAEGRRRIIDEVEEFLHRDLTMLFLCHLYKRIKYPRNLQGMTFDSFGWADFRKLWIRPAATEKPPRTGGEPTFRKSARHTEDWKAASSPVCGHPRRDPWRRLRSCSFRRGQDMLRWVEKGQWRVTAVEEWILFLLIGLLAGTFGSLAGLGGRGDRGPFPVADGRPLSGIPTSHPPGGGGDVAGHDRLDRPVVHLDLRRQRRVDYRSGLLFFAASGPGAATGAYLNRFFEPDSFYIAFGLFLIFVSIVLTVGERGKERPVKWSVTREFTDPDGTVHRYGYHRPTALAVAFLVGMVSSLFGIGGGALMVPVMVFLFRFPPHVATATSMFMIFFSSVIGSLGHVAQGNVEWKAALFLAPGAWFGGRLGAWISSRLSSRGLLVALRLALLLVAVRMIWEGLS